MILGAIPLSVNQTNALTGEKFMLALPLSALAKKYRFYRWLGKFLFSLQPPCSYEIIEIYYYKQLSQLETEMLNNEKQMSGSAYAGSSATTFDAGLRAHMIRIYNAVAAGLALSGLAAYAVYSVPPLAAIFMNPMVSMVLLIGLMAFLWFGMNPNKLMQQSVSAARTKYYIFTALLGTSLSYMFVAYTGDSIVRVFLITAAMFAGTSLLGYTTKRDLSGMGSFLMMGLIGVIIASVVNIFLHSSGMAFIISIIAVLVFTGLIAFESQNAKRLYNSNNSDDTNHKMAIISAVGLYISFINLFQTLLSLLGNRN